MPGERLFQDKKSMGKRREMKVHTRIPHKGGKGKSTKMDVEVTAKVSSK
jgi:hypothetical protein